MCKTYGFSRFAFKTKYPRQNQNLIFVVVFTLGNIGHYWATLGNPPTKQPHLFCNIHSCPNHTKVAGPETVQRKNNLLLVIANPVVEVS